MVDPWLPLRDPPVALFSRGRNSELPGPDRAPENSRVPVFEFFIEVGVLIRNFGVANGVDFALRELTGRNDSPVATLQARILLRRQQHGPFATVLCNRHRLCEGNVLTHTNIAVKLRSGDGDGVIGTHKALREFSMRGLYAEYILSANPRPRRGGLQNRRLLCGECDQLRLSVPGLCLGEPGKGSVLLHPGNLELKRRAGAPKTDRPPIENASFQGILRG